MIVAVTGHRDITEDGILTVKLAIITAMYKIDTLITGGAIGVDTVALDTFIKHKTSKQKAIVVVPNKVENQPKMSRKVICRADEVIELGNPIVPNNGFEAYKIRDRFMVDKADILFAFWESGRTKSGTYYTMMYAENNNTPVKIFYL